MTEIADRLREGRSAATTGVLTIDRASAQERMRLYRLPDPHFYVLQFVRAASMLGAREIEFVVEADTMVCLFDVALPPGSLDDVWNASYALRDTLESGALHNLALGVLSAQALNPAFIEIVSGGTRLDIVGDEATLHDVPDKPLRSYELALLPSDAGSAPRASEHTKITVREKFRLGHLPEFFTRWFGELPEARALRIHCTYSLLNVMVDGKKINTGLPHDSKPRFTGEFEGEVIRAVAVPGETEVDAVLLRDDVMIHRTQVERQLIGATLVMNSRRAEVDLTGLTMRQAPTYFEREMLGAYHRLLRQWLTWDRVRDLSPATLRCQLVILARLVADADEDVAPETRALVDWLFKQPIFERAFVHGEGRHVSLRNAISGTAIEIVTRKIDLPPVGRPRVLLLDDHALQLALQQLGIEVEDVTLQLADEARRKRQKLRWQVQPLRTPPQEASPTGELIEQGEMLALIEASLSGEAKGSRGCRIYLDGRLLRETLSDLPFRIELYGGFRPDEYFDNVDRDTAFDDLALAVVDAARRLCECFVDDRAGALQVMERFIAGTFESSLLGMMGYGWDQAEQLLERTSHTPDERSPLGVPLALFDAPLFDSVAGRSYSLREVVSAEPVPVCIAEHDLLEGPEATRLEREGRMVLWVSPTAWRVIVAVRGDATKFDDARLFEARLKTFLARAPFSARGGKAILEQTVEHDDFTIEARLLDDEGSHATAYLLWRDRQLALHRWNAASGGQWQVVVRSENLCPNPTFDDVVRDDHFREIQQAFAKLSVEMKSQVQGRSRDEAPHGKPPQRDPTGLRASGRSESHDILTAVSDLLREVRGERRELLSDFSLGTLDWANDDQQELCRVDARGATVRRDHPLTHAVNDDDPGRLAFLASCITTQINAYYREISDTDELTLQRDLLRAVE